MPVVAAVGLCIYPTEVAIADVPCSNQPAGVLGGVATSSLFVWFGHPFLSGEWEFRSANIF